MIASIIALQAPETVSREMVLVVVVSITISSYSPSLDALVRVYSVPLMVTLEAFALYLATLITTELTSSATVKLREAVTELVPSLMQELPFAS